MQEHGEYPGIYCLMDVWILASILREQNKILYDAMGLDFPWSTSMATYTHSCIFLKSNSVIDVIKSEAMYKVFSTMMRPGYGGFIKDSLGELQLKTNFWKPYGLRRLLILSKNPSWIWKCLTFLERTRSRLLFYKFMKTTLEMESSRPLFFICP